MTRARILLFGGLAATLALAVPHGSAAAGFSFVTPFALPGGGGGEPSIVTDGAGNVYVGSPEGVPGGQGDYWISHTHGTAGSFSGPTKHGGAAGGGDEDLALASDGTAYLTDLEAADSVVCKSTDLGATWNAVGPTPDTTHCVGATTGHVGPSNDRQWLTTDGASRVYLTYHEFVSAQPVIFRSDNAGADGFTAGPCGSIVSDPTIEKNVPQDITGGTLVAKPVVDGAGTLYILFTTTTQEQNIGAPINKNIAGTFSQAYIAVSTDHCASFTDHVIYDGAATHPANSVQFGDIFNDLAVDPAGNLYVVAAGFIGTTAFAKTADVFLFTSPPGGTSWSAPTQVTTDVGAHVLPAAVAGLAPGQLAIGYFRSTNGTAASRDPNNTADTWTYTVAESTTALSAASFSFQDVNPGTLYHTGDICTSGILCGTGLPGTGSNRSLLDFTSAALDSDGCPLFTFAGNQGTTTTSNFVTKQSTGCFTAPQGGLVAEVPFVPTLLGIGAAATGVAALRRRRAAGEAKAVA